MSATRARKLAALLATLAIIGGVLLWSFHTHDDGSPRGQDDCVVCQIAVGLAVGLAVLALAFRLLLALLARLGAGAVQREIQAIRLTCQARSPPLPA